MTRTRFYLELILLSVLFLPFAALAQEAAQPTGFDTTLGAVLAVALPLLLAVAKMFWKDKADARLRIVNMGIEVAYHATTNIAKFTDSKVDDKIAVALGQLRIFLAANGYALTPAIEQQARVTWGAMHAREKTALSLRSAPAVP